MIQLPGYSVSAEELRRYPPELRPVFFQGAAAVMNVQADVWTPGLQRHSLVTSMTVECTITSTLQASRTVGFYVRVVTPTGDIAADIFSARSWNAQAIIGDNGISSAANATFIGTYNWSSRHPFLVPAGHSIRVTSLGWTTDSSTPNNHTIQASLISLGFPQGNIVR